MDYPIAPHPRGYVCCRAPGPFELDGRLDKPAWRDAAWTEDFVDIEGALRPTPRFRTRAKMMWDDAYFYIGALLEEPHVCASLTEHDSVIFQDNDFEVFLDPDGDNHLYYELEINALNTEWDLLLAKPYRDGGPAINGWEIPGLKTAVHVDGTLNDPRELDLAWSVELALPWKALAECAGRPAPPADGDQWRINFSRVEWRYEIVDGKYRKIAGQKEDNWVWSPQGVVDMHRPEKWGYVQFSAQPAGAAAQPPGPVAFRPDPTHAAREILHAIYWAQRAHFEKHGAYAPTLDVLGLPPLTHKDLLAAPRLWTTPHGWEAIAETRGAAGKLLAVQMREDSRVRVL